MQGVTKLTSDVKNQGNMSGNVCRFARCAAREPAAQGTGLCLAYPPFSASRPLAFRVG
jgi:hypothetical protein